jgi:hypothetical protein
MNMDIKINLKHIEVGSELIELVFGETTIRFYATYVGEEPLSTLIKSVVLLRDRIAENVDYSKCYLKWRSEPGYLNLNFRKDAITDIVILKTESDTPELNDLEIKFGFEEYREAVITESLRILKVYGLKGFNENWCDGNDVFPLNSLLSAMGTECTQTTKKWVVKSDIISELELLLQHLKS